MKTLVLVVTNNCFFSQKWIIAFRDNSSINSRLEQSVLEREAAAASWTRERAALQARLDAERTSLEARLSEVREEGTQRLTADRAALEAKFSEEKARLEARLEAEKARLEAEKVALEERLKVEKAAMEEKFMEERTALEERLAARMEARKGSDHRMEAAKAKVHKFLPFLFILFVNFDDQVTVHFYKRKRCCRTAEKHCLVRDVLF